MNLSNKDYIKILEFYKINIPNKKINKTLRKKAQDILAEKLCRCIKNISKSPKDERRAISICTKTIFRKKGIKYNKFTCKKGAKLHANKKKQKLQIIKSH